jgi:hypothetical protein
MDCRAVFERLVRDQRAINEATRQFADEDEEQVMATISSPRYCCCFLKFLACVRS